MISVQDALDHLGYDEVDEKITAKVTAELDEAKEYLKETVGDDVFTLLPNNPIVDRLLKAYLDDLNDETGTNAKAGNAMRHMISSMELQLRLKLVRLRESEGAGDE